MPLTSNLLIYDEWGSTMSGKVCVTNGVRHGGVSWPLLFKVYVDEISNCLNKASIGGSIKGTVLNHMLYATEICIKFAFFADCWIRSSSSLQQLFP